MKKEKIVLAFSGGLDTSYCLVYLKVEKQFDVFSAIVNTGGLSENELISVEKKAYELGAVNHVALEKKQTYYDQILKYLIYGNVLKNNSYPLSVSAERVCQAIALAEYAKSINAKYIAHGSTGAGNDQIRFDLIFQLIAPEIEIITPVRDQKLTRDDEIDYLAENGVTVDKKKARYSVNKGLWGTSVGGVETLNSRQALPEEAFPSQLEESTPRVISIEFVKGEISGLDGETMPPVKCIEELENIARKYAVGRDIHVGDTILGIKGRVGFEAAAAQIIIKAHHTLEKHNLSKWQLYWKEQLANWYGMFIHEAQYFEPVMRNIETFLEATQTNITGKVFVELHPYRFIIQGIESEYDLMNSDFAEYGEVNKNWSGDDVKGFIKILANSLQVSLQNEKKDD